MTSLQMTHQRIHTEDNSMSNVDDTETNTPLVREYTFDSELIGKYIKLKAVQDFDSDIIMYQIQSISSPVKIETNILDKDNNDIPDLVQESTNQWLLSNNYRCKNTKTEQINFSMAIIVVFVQIISYFILTYYLINDRISEQITRQQTCYGPYCDEDSDKSCMDIKTGAVTIILLTGFLCADFINTISMIKDSFYGFKLIDLSQFSGSIIILIELLSACICGIFVGIFSPSDFEAINGAVGILFVHDLDEKMFLALSIIDNNYRRICSVIWWIILSLVIAATSACIYQEYFWFGQIYGACKQGEFYCDGECIWSGLICNGVEDCNSGLDEQQNCNFSQIICPNDMFRCRSNGACIDIEKRCDGELDCPLGSDEARDQNCASLIQAIDCGIPPSFERLYNDSDWYMTISKQGKYKCKNGQCIDGKYMCDGQVDCVDGSDEYPDFESVQFWPFFRECPYSRLIECDVNEILCKANGKCIGKLRVCDGNIDCVDGQDEKGCDWIWGDPWCEFLDKFQCGSQIAKWNYNNINKSIILFNGSQIYYENVLEIAQYAGGSGKCIPKEYRCDGVWDCKDGSDEELCELFECNDNEYQCPNGQCFPNTWDCTHIPFCSSDQYKGGYFNHCDWFDNITYMKCGQSVTDAITENGKYFNRYDTFIPCSVKAVKFTTCNNYTILFNTMIQGWDENVELHFENDDAQWECSTNYFSSTVILDSDKLICNRTYTIMVGGKYQTETLGNYQFDVVCSDTDF